MAEDGDSVPEVWLSPNPKKTTWTSKRARYGRTPRRIPQRTSVDPVPATPTI